MDRYDLTVRLVIDSEWDYARPTQWNWRELLLLEPDGQVSVTVVNLHAPEPAPQPETEWLWVGFILLHLGWAGAIVVALVAKA